jgi:hypothetical protein
MLTRRTRRDHQYRFDLFFQGGDGELRPRVTVPVVPRRAPEPAPRPVTGRAHAAGSRFGDPAFADIRVVDLRTHREHHRERMNQHDTPRGTG